MTAAGPPGFGGGQVFGGQWVWQPVATVPASAASGAAISMPMVMAMTGGGGGSPKGGKKRGPKTDPNAPHNAKIRAEADKLEAEGMKLWPEGREHP